jgi:predicted CoA-binding protein
VALPREVVDLLRAKNTTRIALVGASNNPRKYGQIILADLLDKGFKVIPVNEHEDVIRGLEVRRTVSELEDPIHIVNFVVPPEKSLSVLEGLDPERFPVVWFQPGAFDRAVLASAKKRKFRHVLAGDCIMVET